MKGNARKVRRLYKNQVIAGFAGGTADAFLLFELFEGKLDKHGGQMVRAAVELAKEWRSDRALRRLEALLCVANEEASLIISGNGDVIEPEDSLMAVGSGGAFAQAAARAMLRHHRAQRKGNRRERLADRRRYLRLHQSQLYLRNPRLRILNVDTKTNYPVADDPARDSAGARQPHHRPGQGQARGRHRAAQPLAAPAGERGPAQRDHARRTS